MPELTVQAMQEMAAQIATANLISVTIFLRLITQESQWNPRAVNPRSGCTGLGQLHPRFFAGDLLDPMVNLHLSASALKGWFHYYDRDYFKALAAYNYGPGNVNGLLREHGSEWMLHLPNETRRYLRVILLKEDT